jgi:molybdopterin molybdotransferase
MRTDPLLLALLDSVPKFPLRTEQVPLARAGSRIHAGGGVTGLDAGMCLGAHELALLAAAGTASVEVFPRPTVAVFSFGDHLLQLGQPAQPDHAFDSAAVMLQVLLAEERIESLAWPALPTARITAALEDALDSFDLVLISAGEGAEQALAQALPALGVSLPVGGEGSPRAWLSSRARLLWLDAAPERLSKQFSAWVRPLLWALQYSREHGHSA